MILPRRLKRLLTRTAYERYEPVAPGQEVHLSHFRPDVLKRLLRRTGFEPGHVTVDDQYPRPSAWTSARVALTRILARSGVNLGNSLLVTARRR